MITRPCSSCLGKGYSIKNGPKMKTSTCIVCRGTGLIQLNISLPMMKLQLVS